MTLSHWFKLFLFLVLCQSAYASETISSFDEKNISVLNEEFRSINGKIRQLNGGLSINSTTGILTTAKGGTGQDFSAASADTMAYFDSTGHMAVSGASGGDSTLFLNGNWQFSSIPDQVRFIYGNPYVGTETQCSGVSCSATSTDILDASTDWLGKKLKFEGNITVANTTLPSAVNLSDIHSTSSTAVTGYAFATTGATNSKQLYQKFFWTASMTNKTFISITGGNSGAVSCDLDINGSGQLVLVTNLVGTAGGGNDAFCRLDDVIIIRER